MIYVFLANGFEEVEAMAPIDLLRRAGAQVMTVGVGTKTVVGAHHVPVIADSDGEGLDFEDMEMVILPGGMPGTLHLDKSPLVERCLKKAQEKDCWIAAICAAPSVLGHQGLLQGRRATCYPGFEQELLGASCTGAAVERDGRIITARGAGAAIEFGLSLVYVWKGESAASELRESIQCQK